MVNRKYQKYWTVLDYTNSLHPNPPKNKGIDEDKEYIVQR